GEVGRDGDRGAAEHGDQDEIEKEAIKRQSEDIESDVLSKDRIDRAERGRFEEQEKGFPMPRRPAAHEDGNKENQNGRRDLDDRTQFSELGVGLGGGDAAWFDDDKRTPGDLSGDQESR